MHLIAGKCNAGVKVVVGEGPVRSRRSDHDLAGQISRNHDLDLAGQIAGGQISPVRSRSRRSDRGGDELSGATGMEVDSAREKRRGDWLLELPGYGGTWV